MSRQASRSETAIFVGLIALSVAPLFAGRYLPFFDYPAHLSVPAALLHRADPATRVSELWAVTPGWFPNSLHYAVCWLLSHVVSLETASRWFVALWCVAGLPLATASFLRAFGRDARLALLAVPLAWNRCLWYGFIGFSAAFPLALLALAVLEQNLERRSMRRELGLAALMALLPFAHFFVMVIALGLGLGLVALHARDTPKPRVFYAALPLLAGPLAIAPWFLGALRGGPQPPGGALEHLFASRPDASDYAALLRHWFLDGYSGQVDEALAVVMVLTVAGALFHTRRETPAVGLTRAARFAPLLFTALLAVVYVALPFEIREPFHWWGMNVRVLPLLFVCALASVAPGRLDGTGRLLLAPALFASAAFFIYVAVDFRRGFNGPSGMQGFDEVLARVPAGARVLGLYTDYRQRPHYAHYPYLYAASYAVVRGGGVAAPFVPIPQSWTNPRAVPEHPFAGDAALFRPERHTHGFSHFLVRTCDGDGCVADPIARAPETRRVIESGRWRLYESVAARAPGVR